MSQPSRSQLSTQHSALSTQHFRVYDTAAARAGILCRRPPDEAVLAPEMQAGVRAHFGRDLSAEEAVRAILHDVRHEGDAAVRRYTAAFDGVTLDALEVAPAELRAALAALAAG